MTRWTILKQKGRTSTDTRFDLCAESPNGSFPLVSRHYRMEEAVEAGVIRFGQEGRVNNETAFPKQ